MSGLAERIVERRRLAILIVLDEAGVDVHTDILVGAIADTGAAAHRVGSDLDWLANLGAVRLRDLDDDVRVAAITDLGADLVHRRACRAGVARPR